ncbi:acid protease [Lecanosticta acicola]|uniref:Acid protease n=1 Tax=Lecanosticta acicola TaxID=111012 RepID=A0AAI8Z0S9_9PEZI|nr:acid protease [Lecanosticta acicola]
MAQHLARFAAILATATEPLTMVKRASSEELKPISVPASGSWQGYDGEWSTFHVQVGSPPQLLHLLPGTSVQAGNAIWAIAPEGCTVDNPGLWDCAELRGDVFNMNDSSTWKSSANGSFYNLGLIAENMLGLHANATYGLDTVTLGTDQSGLPSLPNQLVAGVQSNDFWIGSLGISPLRLNASSGDVGKTPTLMGALRDPNDTKIPSTTWAYTAGAAYKDAPVFGSLTLGGYDANRFDPNTSVSVPFSINPSADLQVNLQSITYDTEGSSPLLTQTITPYVNSMITYIWMPIEVCQAFEAAFGLEWDNATELYLLNETTHDRLQRQNPTFSFTLGGSVETGETAEIRIPYDAFDLNVTYPHVNGSRWYFPLKRAQYGSQYTLGRVFLQEAYVIADYDRRNFTVAQALFPTDSTPELVTILPPGESDNRSSSLSGGAIAGTVIGVLAGVAVVVAGLAFWFWRRRRQQQSTPPPPATTGVEEVDGAQNQIHEKLGAPVARVEDSTLPYKPDKPPETGTYSPSELPSETTLDREFSWPSELPAEMPPVQELASDERRVKR